MGIIMYCVNYPGTFHLLHMLVDDYIIHTVESMREKEEEERHLDRINIHRGTYAHSVRINVLMTSNAVSCEDG